MRWDLSGALGFFDESRGGQEVLKGKVNCGESIGSKKQGGGFRSSVSETVSTGRHKGECPLSHTWVDVIGGQGY